RNETTCGIVCQGCLLDAILLAGTHVWYIGRVACGMTGARVRRGLITNVIDYARINHISPRGAGQEPHARRPRRTACEARGWSLACPGLASVRRPRMSRRERKSQSP